MNPDTHRIDSIFLAAAEKATAEERAAYLDKACGSDAELRERVERLLAAQSKVSSFLEAPAPALIATVDDPALTERPGTIIGPYKLLEQIGEGGFGVVFLAEQSQPVRRKVALKVLKPGMDTQQVIARFEAERQALALMDHPNIAKVHDGGATDTGRPYFVLELVKGVPITEFCDQNHLTPRQRLELFLPVCQAVQHAHQKGIIHRDLKPSNILVSAHDATPMVKVIDFGVAKALGQELTEKTLFTGRAQMIGTPIYMSPEQAGMSDLDVDTRSDTYSLGVLLYELLTGTTPFTKERFKAAAYEEIRRIIREEDPPKPSTRLSESKDSLASISAQRHMEPTKLTKLVSGELDWIVMKCLDKDRNRRYETANGLARDIECYLHDEPVEAGPPSRWYRFRKFARRNKAALAVFSVLAMAALATVAILLVSNYRIMREKNEKAIALEDAARNAARAQEAVNRYFTIVSEDSELKAKGLETLRRKLLTTAREYYLKFVEESGDNAALRRELAEAHFRLGLITEALGDNREATREFQEAMTLSRQLVETDPANSASQALLARNIGSVGRLKHAVGQSAQAEAATLEALAIFKQLAKEGTDPEHEHELAVTLNGLGVIYADTSRPKEAEAAYQQAADIWQQLVRQYPDRARYQAPLATTQSNLGVRFENSNRLRDAEQVHGEALEHRRTLVREYPGMAEYERDLADSLLNLGALYDGTGRPERAVPLFVEALGIWRRLVGLHRQVVEYQSRLAAALNNLANAYSHLNRPKEADEAYQEAISIRRELVNSFGDVVEFAIELGGSLCNFGNRAQEAGQFAKAVEWYDQSVEALEVVLRREPRQPTARLFLRNAHFGRASSLWKLGRRDQALSDYEEALRLDPDYAEAHCNLGNSLIKVQRFREGLAHLRRGHELGSKRPDWRYRSADWVRDAEILLRFDEEITALRRGESAPTDVRERLGLAEFCVMHKRLPLTGLRLWTGLFAEGFPKAEDEKAIQMYNAACAAALAASGDGLDVAELSDGERAHWRKHALDWLRGTLDVWIKRVDNGSPDDCNAIEKRMKSWQDDSDLVSLRTEAAVSKLPEADQELCRKLWADVGALRAQARAKAGAADPARRSGNENNKSGR